MKVKIKISKHTSNELTNKMYGLVSINTYTLCNKYCHANYNNSKEYKTKTPICKYCYSIYQLSTFRVNCKDTFRHNTLMLSTRILHDSEIPIINNAIIRINSHGELINYIHFINICNIAKNNRYAQFTIFTKRKDIIKKYYKYIPDNLILVYSSRYLNHKENLPLHFNKVFTVYTDEYTNNHNTDINCIGQCIKCLKCYNKDDRTVYINEVVKQYTFSRFINIRNKIRWEII